MNTPKEPDTSFEAKALELLEELWLNGHHTGGEGLSNVSYDAEQTLAQLQNLISQDIIGEDEREDITEEELKQRNPNMLTRMRKSMYAYLKQAPWRNMLRAEQRKALGLGISREGDR